MEATKVAEYARSLYEAHGDNTEAEAAQKARQSREAGNSEEADTWETTFVTAALEGPARLYRFGEYSADHRPKPFAVPLQFNYARSDVLRQDRQVVLDVSAGADGL